MSAYNNPAIWPGNEAGLKVARNSTCPTQSEPIPALAGADLDYSANPLRWIKVGATGGILELQLYEDAAMRQFVVAANERFEGLIMKIGKNTVATTLIGMR